MKSLFSRKKRVDWNKISRGIGALFSILYKRISELFDRLSGGLRRKVIISKLHKADIILASPKTLRLSPIALIYRLLLQARYVHSMLYIGNERIIHTTTRHGVSVNKLPRKIYKKERYTILRTRRLSRDQGERAVREALRIRHKKLDHAGLITNIPSKLLGLKKPLLRLEKNRLWCSKLIYQTYLRVGIELVSPDKAETVTSEDLNHSRLLEKI